VTRERVDVVVADPRGPDPGRVLFAIEQLVADTGQRRGDLLAGAWRDGRIPVSDR